MKNMKGLKELPQQPFVAVLQTQSNNAFLTNVALISKCSQGN